METFSAILAISAGNWPVTRSFDVFIDLRLNERFIENSNYNFNLDEIQRFFNVQFLPLLFDPISQFHGLLDATPFH